MKKSNYPKLISELYKEAGRSDEIVINLEWLESQNPCVETLLEGYRYLQPDGEMFSEDSLKIIIALDDIERMLEAQKELAYDIEVRFKTFLKWAFKQTNGSEDFISECDPF